VRHYYTRILSIFIFISFHSSSYACDLNQLPFGSPLDDVLHYFDVQHTSPQAQKQLVSGSGTITFSANNACTNLPKNSSISGLFENNALKGIMISHQINTEKQDTLVTTMEQNFGKLKQKPHPDYRIRKYYNTVVATDSNLLVRFMVQGYAHLDNERIIISQQ